MPVSDEVQEQCQEAVAFVEKFPAHLQPVLLEFVLRPHGPPPPSASQPAFVQAKPIPSLSGARPTTLEEKVRLVKPSSGTEFLLLAARELESDGSHAEGWGKDEVFELFRRMRFNPTNPHDVFTKATRAGLIMPAAKGFMLTNTGIDKAESMEAAPSVN